MSKSDPLLSIIILSFNTKELTKKCLRSVYNSLSHAPFSFEVLVVDNASTDTSVSMIAKQFPDVVLVQNKQNSGFGAANNQAVKKATGKLIFFLNSDAEVLDSAVEEMVTYITEHPNVHFLGGKLLNIDRTPQASCGPFLNLWVVFMMLFLQGERFGITRYSPDTISEVDWISGACIMCRKKDFSKIDGFDEGIFLYMEEVELLYRAKQKNMHVWFIPHAQFVHVGSGSSKQWKTPIMNLYKGLLYFYAKHESYGKQIVLRLLLATKAVIGIVVGKLVRNTRIYEAYQAGLQVSLRGSV